MTLIGIGDLAIRLLAEVAEPERAGTVLGTVGGSSANELIAIWSALGNAEREALLAIARKLADC